MIISNPPRTVSDLSARLWPQPGTDAGQWNAESRAIDLQVALPSIDVVASSQDLMAFFAIHFNQHVVAVVEFGVPIGLINKSRFVASYLPHRQRLDAANLSCLSWMTPRTLIVDAQAALPELLLRAQNEGAPIRDDGFIVTEQGRYKGVATGLALRTALLDLESRAQRERLDSMNFALPMQQHLDFVSHENLERGIADHYVVRESRQLVTASGVFARRFERGTLAIVLEGKNQGAPCFKLNLAAQLWMDAYVPLHEASGEDIDPGQWLQRLHVHLLRDVQAQDEQAGANGDDLIAWRLGDGLKIAALWLPHHGRSLRFAGSRMDLLLTRPASRDTQVLRGTFDLLGNAAAPENSGWAVQEVALNAVHRALVVTDGVTDQIGGPFAEPLGMAVLNGFMRSHSTLNARDIGPMLADFLHDWRGTKPAPEDLTALVLSVGGGR